MRRLLCAAALAAAVAPVSAGQANAIGVCLGADVRVTDVLVAHDPYGCFPSVADPLPPIETKHCETVGGTRHPGATLTLCVGTWD